MNDLVQRAMMRPRGGGLPSGYIPCETIGTDGYTSFIDSMVTPLPTMSIEAEARFVLPSGASQYLFGYIIGGSRFTPLGTNGQRKVETGYGYFYPNDSYELPFGTLLRFKIVVTPNGSSYEVRGENEELLATFSIPYTEAPLIPQTTMALLGRKTGEGEIENGSFRGSGGRIKLYSDDHFGTLYADYEPSFNGMNFGYFEHKSRQFLEAAVPANVIGFGEYWGTEGFMNNTYHWNGREADDRGYVLSPFYQVQEGCTSIRFNCSTIGTSPRILLFNANKVNFDYFSYNSADRIVSVPNTTKYIRLMIQKGGFQSFNAYAYDVTHSEYIHKQINAHIPE